MKLEKITDKAKTADKRWYDDACGTALAMELVGERWSLLIVRELMFGPRRFGELRGGLPGISANVLTQRLEGLEAAGILTRRKLPPPASVQVYELTPWGYESEVAIQELGRWAVRSPAHDPTLPLSAASIMMSFRTMIDRSRSGAFAANVGFMLGNEGFLAEIDTTGITICRVDQPAAPVVFTTDPMTLASVVYGGRPFADAEGEGTLTIRGDRALADRFVTLFPLPAKIGARVDTAERVISASQAAVWDALTVPDKLARWVSPRGMTSTIDAFDLRTGGGYRMTLRHDSPHHPGKSGKGSDEVSVRFVTVDPETRLDELVDFTSDDPAFAGSMKMTWLIEPSGADTRVTVRATDVPPGIDAEAHLKGLASSLANLAAFLA